MIGFERYRGARVLVTGDTGFKGSWLSCWLESLGAEVHGVGLEAPPGPALFDALGLADRVHHRWLDVRDREALARHVAGLRPEFVFHLAAQPLVRRSFEQPLETVDTNVVGTLNLLAALERAGYSESRPCSVVIVTSDKCYRNDDGAVLEEDRPMGGRDLYSASKGMAELLVAAWRTSIASNGVRIATARAGNVIGGGDWAEDRIVPDAMRALAAGRVIRVRNPAAQRPWQHVLDALSGYLRLGQELADSTDPSDPVRDGFNFGPNPRDEHTVAALCDAIVDSWGQGAWQAHPQPGDRSEAPALRLSIDRAARVLDWRPVWPFEDAVAAAVDWYRTGFACEFDPGRMRAISLAQIEQFAGLVSS